MIFAWGEYRDVTAIMQWYVIAVTITLKMVGWGRGVLRRNGRDNNCKRPPYCMGIQVQQPPEQSLPGQ